MSRLVSAKDMLNKARDGKYAVGQFNINNLEWTSHSSYRSGLNSPVILGVSGRRQIWAAIKLLLVC